MPPIQRVKTPYPGVYYISGTNRATGKQEKIYYIRYCLAGKQIDEKVGHQYQDDMTPARANAIRADRVMGKAEPNKVRRAKALDAENKWTMDRLWAEYEGQRDPSKGVRSDYFRYRKYLAPSLGNKEPQELCTLDVARISKALAGKLKPQTIKHLLALVKRLLLFGVRQGLINMPDTRQLFITLPRADDKKTEDLTQEQVARLWKALDEEPNAQVAAIMKLALLTGMRRGEILKLRWDDLDFERQFITIRPENAKGGTGSKIPMSRPTREVLEGLPRNSDFVFPGNGPRGHRTSVQIASNKIKEKAGLPKDFRPMHGLRHVFASMLASSGKVDMYTLQKLLTHKSPMMTQRYAHLRDATLRSASDLAGETVMDLVTAPHDNVIALKIPG
jgi:integrase